MTSVSPGCRGDRGYAVQGPLSRTSPWPRDCPRCTSPAPSSERSKSSGLHAAAIGSRPPRAHWRVGLLAAVSRSGAGGSPSSERRRVPGTSLWQRILASTRRRILDRDLLPRSWPASAWAARWAGIERASGWRGGSSPLAWWSGHAASARALLALLRLALRAASWLYGPTARAGRCCTLAAHVAAAPDGLWDVVPSWARDGAAGRVACRRSACSTRSTSSAPLGAFSSGSLANGHPRRGAGGGAGSGRGPDCAIPGPAPDSRGRGTRPTETSPAGIPRAPPSLGSAFTRWRLCALALSIAGSGWWTSR